MKIQLIKNSGLIGINKIFHNGDFSVVESYLEDRTDYLIDDFNFDIPDSVGKDIKQTKFKNTFRLDSIEGYDSAVVEDYPFIEGKSFWIIKNKNYLDNGQWDIEFELDLVSTYGISKLDIDKEIAISRKHMNYSSQFNNYLTGDLKNDSIYRHQQPSNDFEIKSFKFEKYFYNEREDEIAEYLRTDNFLVYVLARDSFDIGDNFEVGLTALNTDIEPSETNYFSEHEGYAPDSYITAIIPATFSNINFLDTDGTETGNNSSPMGLFIRELKDWEEIQYAGIIDYNPNPQYQIIGETTEDNTVRSWGLDNGIKTSYVLIKTDGENEAVGVIPDVVTKKGYTTTYNPIGDELFQFKLPDSFFAEDDDLNKWDTSQVLEIEFSPFKSFEIGAETENPYSKNIISNNDLNNMPLADKVLFERTLSPNAQASTHYDTFDTIFGNGIHKTSRHGELAHLSNAWADRNNQKIVNSISDWAGPIKAAAAGAAVGGPVGAAVGGGLAAFNTVLKNQKMKNAPSTLQNTSNDLKDEMVSGYNTKNLYIHGMDGNTKNAVAFEFHKWGTYHFEYSIKYSLDKLLPRIRFNYLELSQVASVEHIKELDLTYALSYLDQLKNGIVFWSWDISDQINNYLFNYNYKNPDKEGILEKINKYDVNVQTGYSYAITLDNSTGKYDNGILFTYSFRTDSDTMLRENTYTSMLPFGDYLEIRNEYITNATLMRVQKLGTIGTANARFSFDLENVSADGYISIIGAFNSDDFSVEETPSTKKSLKKKIKMDEKIAKANLKNRTPLKIARTLTEEQKAALDKKTNIGGR